MSGVGWPHSPGWHEPKRLPTGELVGRIPKEETQRREAKRKTDMEKYFARSKAAEERMLKQAKGIRDPNEIAPPSDVLGFVELQLLSDPALLDRKGNGNVRVLTDSQRRARRRAALDTQAADARKALDRAIKGDDEAPDYSWASFTDEELDSILGEDDEDDPLADLWAQEGDE